MGVRAIPSSVARDPYHDHGTDGSVRAFGGTETVDNLPASPPPLSTHKGRRGSVGVLMPETGDVTHELPKKPIPIKSALKPEIGARIRTEAHYL